MRSARARELGLLQAVLLAMARPDAALMLLLLGPSLLTMELVVLAAIMWSTTCALGCRWKVLFARRGRPQVRWKKL